MFKKSLLFFMSLALMIVILIITILLILSIPTIANNLRLQRFERQLKEHPQPSNTQVIETVSTCGKLNGNGNGMDYFACILIKSDQSHDSLIQYFSQASFDTARQSDHNVIIDISIVDGYKLETPYVERKDINFTAIHDLNEYQGYYIVSIYDGGYPAGLDLRGN